MNEYLGKAGEAKLVTMMVHWPSFGSLPPQVQAASGPVISMIATRSDNFINSRFVLTSNNYHSLKTSATPFLPPKPLHPSHFHKNSDSNITSLWPPCHSFSQSDFNFRSSWHQVECLWILVSLKALNFGQRGAVWIIARPRVFTSAWRWRGKGRPGLLIL